MKQRQVITLLHKIKGVSNSDQHKGYTQRLSESRE